MGAVDGGRAADLLELRHNVVRVRCLAPAVAKVDELGPVALAIRAQRSPKYPADTTSTRSRGEHRFATAESIAPLPDAVNMITSPSVRKTSGSRAKTRARIAENSGER